MSFAPLRPASLRVNVTDLLREALLSQRFRPGDELTDTALAAEFGVSRGPIREALILLAQEGLIEHRHYRGFRLPVLTREDFLQINQARLPLEVEALRLARPRATAADFAKLRKLKKALLKARQASDETPRFTAKADFDFHCHIWEMTGNPWLVAGLRRICTSRFLYTSGRDLGFPELDLSRMDAIHQAYIDYLSSNTARSAEACVREHLHPILHPDG